MTNFASRSLVCSTLALVVAGMVPTVAMPQGFEISLNGNDVVRDTQVATVVRSVDVRLAQADVQISYDGVDPERLLNIEMAAPVSGGQVRLVNETNYPAFITRGELRLIDLGAPGGERLVSTTPLGPNQAGQIAVPAGDYAVVYRVYGQRGRFDETQPLRLSAPDTRGLSPDIEEGADFIGVQNIRVRGGAVTVNAKNIAPGGTLHAMGEVIRADANGRAVIQRILPSGDHAVAVEVRDSRGPLSFGRDIEVDTSDWLYFAVADVEFYRNRDRNSGAISTGNSARFQVFVDGETQSGIEITGSLDTSERPIDEVFRRLMDKDPRAIASRIETDPAQLTFGDDSETTDLTPTSGRVYLKVQRDESFALWGDYQAGIEGSGFLRNQRALYGAQLHFESNSTTQNGDARVAVDLVAAQRDQLFGREAFRGTDGTVFFLSRQDLTADTVRVQIELRDADTGRVVERIDLEQGEDYLINEFQGVLRLNDPVAASQDSGLIQNSNGDLAQFVVVQYEYTPVGFAASGTDVSGRAEAWASDALRFGVTGLKQNTGATTQTAYGVDLRYELGDNSFVQLDYAKTEGPGFDFSSSSDAGLISSTTAGTDGTGEAFKLEFELDYADLDPAKTGVVGGYAELREQGFSTLDYQVTAATGDQRLLGIYARGELASGLTYAVNADELDNEIGDDTFKAGAEVGVQLNNRFTLDVAAEHQQIGLGERTDVGARLTYAPNADQSVYAFAQNTIANTGLADNDRYGIGADLSLGNDWTLTGEVSDGSIGYGLKLAAQREDADGSSTYFGWETDPQRAYAQGINNRDNGRLVFGGRRHIDDAVSVYGENTYDLLGTRRELTSAYGVDYTPSDYLAFGTAIAFGQVQDDSAGDVERQAYTVSMAYDDDTLKGQMRLEYRLDQELNGSGRSDVDTIVVAGDLRWQIDDSQRLLLGVLASRTDADTGSVLGGDYVDASIGYAYRPVDHERMNVLASYRYLQDDFGQAVDGVAGAGPVQRSHVLNLEGNYDLNPHWTIGAKLGVRASESAQAKGDTYSGNDAGLAILNARYHLAKRWDVLLETRHFVAVDNDFSETGGLAAVYRHFGNNVKAGVGYNFTSFSDDLTDLTQDDEGVFLNLVAKF